MKQKRLILFNWLFLLFAILVGGTTSAWAQSDYSSDYTGNVTLSTDGGSNATACYVNISNTNYAGIKAGTSSKAYENAEFEDNIPEWRYDRTVYENSIYKHYYKIVAGDTPGTMDAYIEFAGNQTNKPVKKILHVTVYDPAGTTPELAYTVDQARAAIDKGAGTQGVYVKGIVSEIVTPYDSQYGTISYNITDDGDIDNAPLLAYRGRSFNGDPFTSADDIQVGDKVVVYGDLKKYNYTYEFAQNNQLVSQRHPGRITVAQTYYEADAKYTGTGDGHVSVTIEFTPENVTMHGGNSQYALDFDAVVMCDANGNPTTYDWLNLMIIVPTSNVGFFYFNDNDGEPRTAYLKFYGVDADGNDVYSDLVTITQKSPEPAILVDPTDIQVGCEGLTAQYGTIAITRENMLDYQLDVVFYDVNGNETTCDWVRYSLGNDGNGNKLLQYWVDANKSEEQRVARLKLHCIANYVGDVYSDLITITQEGRPAASITPEKTSYMVDAKPSEDQDVVWLNIPFTYENVMNWGENNIWDEDGNYATWTGTTWMNKPIDAGTLIICSFKENRGESDRTAYMQVMRKDEIFQTEPVYSPIVTITQKGHYAPAAVGKGQFVKVTSPDDVTDGDYLIVYENGGVAFNGGLTTLDATGNNIIVDIDLNEHKIPASQETVAAVFTINRTGVGQGTLKSASGIYIGKEASGNGMDETKDETEAYTNTFDINADGHAIITGAGGNILRYNIDSNQNRFRYYGNGQQPVQLYKFVQEPVITLNAACHDENGKIFGTYYTYRSYVMPTGLAGSTVNIDENGQMEVSERYPAGSVVPGGTALLISTTESFTGTKSYVCETTKEKGTTYSDNMLRGTLTTVEMTKGDDTRNYTYKYYRLTMHNGTDIGFWYGAADGGAFAPGENKAYLPVRVTQAGVRNGFSFDDATTGISNVNVNVNGKENVYDLQGRKVSTPGKGLYIVNGKKVVIK